MTSRCPWRCCRWPGWRSAPGTSGPRRAARWSRQPPAGRVDDLELSDPEPGQAPVLTALLCGTTAFGPRLGGRLGTWWQAVGRRLRPVSGSYPNRVPAELIDHVDRLEITLLTPREHLDSYRFRRWAAEKVINRIPGSGA
jgi:hypothetical protein